MTKTNLEAVASVIQLSGGELIGRTRLQKTTCLLEMAGATFGFSFDYHLYGPYSEELNIAASDAGALRLVEVNERTASWGGKYFVFRAKPNDELAGTPLGQLATIAAKADGIVLELAVTAAFLAKNGAADPWKEVKSRKSVKATPERMSEAKALYKELSSVKTPMQLPQF